MVRWRLVCRKSR